MRGSFFMALRVNSCADLLIIIIIIIMIIIDEQRSQKPTSLLAFPKFSAVAFLRGDLLCTDETIVTVKHVHVDQASLTKKKN